MNTPDNRPSPVHDNPSKQPFEQRAREVWLEAGRHVTPSTAGRLRAARRQALEAANAPRQHGVRWLVPSGAFAAIALAALMMWQPLTQHASAPPLQATTSAIDNNLDLDSELPPDADQTDPNLYQDLDFYGWLAANDSRTAVR
ncbi:MAG: hypothetical protein ACTS5I_00320 [Rhodanobacter sp.]